MAHPAPMFLQIAEELASSRGYLNVSFTAPGAFKETYRANVPSGPVIALKILDPAKCSIARVDREIQAMKRCDSPRIAKLFESGRFRASGGEEFLFVIEEFLDGGSLTDKMSAQLSTTTVRGYARCLCEALEHLASLNLVHRDIKPDNIMFRLGIDEPILVDFGLVRDLTASSLTVDWIPQGPGSPYYSSPEQLNNDKPLIQWRSDQFSLGVVLGLCLTAYHPFESPGMNMADTVTSVASRQKCTQQFVAQMQELGFPNIPRMLEPWPINRYPTAAELLRSFLP